MNAPRKYVVSKTLQQPTWRDTTIIRDNVIESVRALKAQPGKNILTDGSVLLGCRSYRPPRRSATNALLQVLRIPSPVDGDSCYGVLDLPEVARGQLHVRCADVLLEAVELLWCQG